MIKKLPRSAHSASIVLVTGLLLAVPAAAADSKSNAAPTAQPRKSMVMPLAKPENGRRLFVTKGCVICHAVRGVGGRAGPALDAPGNASTIDVLDFVARMWRGASIMSELQEMELGYRVELTAPEMADLAGFVSDAAAQQSFSLAEVPEVMREWMVDEPYWEDEKANWREKLPDEYPDLEPMSER